MKYWERWIGDWKKKTAHLTLEQKGAYAELLDHIYANEAPLPRDLNALQRLAGAVSDQERAALKFVLDNFFSLGPDGYTNQKATEEINKRRAYVSKKRNSAESRWQKERGVGNGMDLNLIPTWWRYDDGIRDTFQKLGLKSDPTESLYDAKQRCFDEIKRRKGAQDG